MYKSILCPIDFSSSTEFQIRFAKSLAENQHAKITALHVLQAPLAQYDIGSYLDVENMLAEPARKELARVCGEEITPVFTMGRTVAMKIVEMAQSKGCDLILMPTHGLTGWKQVLLGSIFHGVLAHTSVAVLSLPPRFVEKNEPIFSKPAHILCAIDLQKGSGALVNVTEQLATEFSASFTVAHNVELDTYLEEMVPQDVFHNVHSNVQSRILREYVSAQAADEIVVTRGHFSENLKKSCDQNRTGLVILGLSRSSPVRVRTTLYRAVVHLDVPALCVPVD